MKYGVAIDLGTSGYRAQKIDLDTGEIKRLNNEYIKFYDMIENDY